MTSNSFYEDGGRLLTRSAFDFVLEGELKRTVRAQTFLTLVVVEAHREGEGVMGTADDGTMHEVAQIVGREIRDTDVMGCTDKGMLSFVLIDADYDHSTRVVNRLVSRIESYEFPMAVRIAVGAACYPMHAVDADSLKRLAQSHPIVQWRSVSSTGERN